MTKCTCGYQTYSFLQWEALFFLIFPFFGEKIPHFSTFGANHDDHEHWKLIYGQRFSSKIFSFHSTMSINIYRIKFQQECIVNWKYAPRPSPGFFKVEL